MIFSLAPSGVKCPLSRWERAGVREDQVSRHVAVSIRAVDLVKFPQLRSE